MTEPSIILDGDLRTGTVTLTHGGAEGTQLRAAVLDGSGVVTALVLLPPDWHEQDPAQRWGPDPDLELVVLDGDEAALAVLGARRVDGAWVAPEPAALPAAASPVADLGDLVGALRALTPDQAEQLQQLLAAPSGG